MKTLEEVKAHLAKVGYRSNEIPVIEGFLFGKGLYEGEEFEAEFIVGDNNFFDFKDWFDGEEEKNKPEIDWDEFGFGDFIHIQEGIDVVLLGGIHGEEVVCVNDRCEVKCFLVNDETRPCNEEEMDSLIKSMNEYGFNFCFANNEFISKRACCVDCGGCKEEIEVRNEIDNLMKDYRELCRIAESMSEDNPCKGMAKAIVEMVGAMVDDVKESAKNDSESIDMLEIGAKDAIENIIANIHAGTLEEKEKHNVINALQGLVELGKMYE